MYLIKRQFNNGVFDCLEIYHNEYKILEKTNGTLWNTDIDHPITIAKSRRDDYVVSNKAIEPFDEK